MIRVEDLSVQLGNFSLEEISFEIPDGEYAVLMGKTGSGKTTLLECICGLRPVTGGRIVLGDRDITSLSPARRGIGYVPQDGALFPTMTVREHLAFPLEIRRWSAADIVARSEELANLLSIGHLLDRHPKGLSGGEMQRVAIGRALSFHPQWLLLDEPLSALDDETRIQLYDLLKKVQDHTQVTALHITHNRQDAEHLSDRTFRIDDGRVIEIDASESFLVASETID